MSYQDALVFALVSGIVTVGILFFVSRLVLRRSADFRRTSVILLVVAFAVGTYLPLRTAGDDPIPSELAGEIIGSLLVIVSPIAIAIALESRRRKANTTYTADKL